jgi:hypothetical protein
MGTMKPAKHDITQYILSVLIIYEVTVLEI